MRARRLLLITLALSLIGGAVTARAATAFADPAFQVQWQTGEAITPNFWGPLATAHDTQQESYKESQGGQRLVQYFDKGRMELTNGTVTNGLLASEILRGKAQTGDATFQDRTIPQIPIAGDPDTPGPTYAGLASKGAKLLAIASPQIGASVTAVVGADGAIAQGDPASGGGPIAIAAYDDATKHNVPGVFADYRQTAGLAAIGLAISEPFRTSVKVGGQPKDVIIQAFERRILTYTASNPVAFRVEMGNIGQHYYQWRYLTSEAIVPGHATDLTQLYTVVNQQYRIAFSYPKNWEVSQTGRGANTIYRYLDADAFGTLRVDAIDAPPGRTLDAVMDDAIPGYFASNPGAKPGPKGRMETTLGGQRAIYFDLVAGSGMYHFSYNVLFANRFYIVEFVAFLGTNQSEFTNAANAVINSWVFCPESGCTQTPTAPTK